jgi:hypothetical protein
MQKYLEVRYGAKGKSRRTNGRDASGGDEMTHHDDLFILSEKLSLWSMLLMLSFLPEAGSESGRFN